MKLPVSRLPASKATGAVTILDANSDCVCVCDDTEMATDDDGRLRRSGEAGVPDLRAAGCWPRTSVVTINFKGQAMTAFGSYKINDRRGKEDPIRKPEILPCRVCGCPKQHTNSYNTPTMDCIKYLRGLLASSPDAASSPRTEEKT